MQIQDVKIENYKMQMNVNVAGEANLSVSGVYVMSDIAKFQIQAIINPIAADRRRVSQGSSVWIFGKFINITNNIPIYIKFSSKALGVKDVNIPADSKWHLIPDNYVLIYRFDVYFTVEIDTSSIDKLKILYDNEETDFEIRGDDCSIGVHKCMLAATSPVFKAMLKGDWQEIKNGYVHLEGMSKVTLEDFKKYIYLNSLPSKVSEQVLIIAMRYDIPHMETMCIKNFIQNMEAENVRDLIEFAITHKSDKLLIEILRCVQYNIIKVNEISEHIYNVKNNEAK